MKTKKILLAVFLALFLIPEILLSPVANMITGLRVNYIFRETVFFDFSLAVALLVLVIQLIGAIGSAILLFKISKYTSSGHVVLPLFGTIFIIVSILTALSVFITILADSFVLF